ncbi:MAG: alpha/beta hydrolase [Abditibacteriota bacterium]|nr:alpha/beta hydrolase [Abditibacteriota bacterium]
MKYVLVHGGPGAIGSLHGFAKELRFVTGAEVAEAVQTKYTIPELIEETASQITDSPIVIGHSWGAWLAALTLAKHADIAEKFIAVGCAPLTDEYVPIIRERRLANLTESEAQEYLKAENEGDIETIARLTAKSDNFSAAPGCEGAFDKALFDAVWPKAAEMRTRGEILKAFTEITCPMHFIFGDRDPHPSGGVTEPLDRELIDYDMDIITDCGHSPFKELFAAAEFFEIILS